MNTVLLEFVPMAEAEAEDLAERLRVLDEVDAVTVERNETSRFAAETALVVILLGSAGFAVCTRLVDWLRDRRDCLLVIDARHDDLRVEERCDVVGRRGQVVIVTSGKEQVVIQRSDALDIQAILACAIEQSAEAAASLAKSLGAAAQVEAPRGDI